MAIRGEGKSERVLSTTLFVAIADKQGHRESPYMLVTVPAGYTTNAATAKGDSTGEQSSPPAQQEGT